MGAWPRTQGVPWGCGDRWSPPRATPPPPSPPAAWWPRPTAWRPKRRMACLWRRKRRRPPTPWRRRAMRLLRCPSSRIRQRKKETRPGISLDVTYTLWRDTRVRTGVGSRHRCIRAGGNRMAVGHGEISPNYMCN